MRSTPTSGSGRRWRTFAVGFCVLQLLQPLTDAAPSQPASLGRDPRAEEALHSFCHTFSSLPSLCGPLRRVKRSTDDTDWSGLLTNVTIKLPDTKWCGAGTSASSYDDLGAAQATDRCCRQHDHCPISLVPGQTQGGITNTGGFARSGCECESEFFDCLVKAGTVHSQLVGELYFNVLQPECIERSRAGRCKRECQDTKQEKSQSKDCGERLQFVPAPLAGQFPEPPNEEAMMDKAHNLVVQAFQALAGDR